MRFTIGRETSRLERDQRGREGAWDLACDDQRRRAHGVVTGRFSLKSKLDELLVPDVPRRRRKPQNVEDPTPGALRSPWKGQRGGAWKTT